MPTYDYRCKKCDHTWEEFQSIKAPASKKCPACKKLGAERQISAGAGILFRGSGFYLTDYRSDSYKKAAAADSGSSGSSKSEGGKSESGGGGGGSKESKPAKGKD